MQGGHFKRCSKCGKEGHNKTTCGRRAGATRKLKTWKRKYEQRVKEERKQAGLCWRCGGELSGNYKRCIKCRMAEAMYKRQWKADKKDIPR